MSPCPVFLRHLIWKQKFKIFNEVCQRLSEQTNFPLHSNLALFTDAHLVGKLIITDSLLCPWGKKALKLFLNSPSSDNGQPVNMDASYGPLGAHI